MKDDGNSFYNDEVKIKYSIADVDATKLKSATIALDEALPKHELVISNHLRVDVDEKTAVFTFNY